MDLIQKYQAACIKQFQIAHTLFAINQATKLLSYTYNNAPWIESHNFTSLSYEPSYPLKQWESYKVFSSLLKCQENNDIFWQSFINDGVTLYKNSESFTKNIYQTFKNLNIDASYIENIKAVCMNDEKLHDLQQYCQFNSYSNPEFDPDLTESDIYSIYCTKEYIHYVCDLYMNC